MASLILQAEFLCDKRLKAEIKDCRRAKMPNHWDIKTSSKSFMGTNFFILWRMVFCMFLLLCWKRHLDKVRNCSQSIAELHKERKLSMGRMCVSVLLKAKKYPWSRILNHMDCINHHFPDVRYFFMFYDGIALAAYLGKQVSGKLNPILQVCSFSSYQMILRFPSPLCSFSPFFLDTRESCAGFMIFLMELSHWFIRQAALCDMWEGRSKIK